jgi:hypothetical protein
MLIQHNLARTHRLVSCRSAGGILDHLIGTGEQNRGQVEANSLCRLHVYGKFEAPGLLNRKIRRIRALRDFVNKGGRAAVISTMSGPYEISPPSSTNSRPSYITGRLRSAASAMMFGEASRPQLGLD